MDESQDYVEPVQDVNMTQPPAPPKPQTTLLPSKSDNDRVRVQFRTANGTEVRGFVPPRTLSMNAEKLADAVGGTSNTEELIMPSHTNTPANNTTKSPVFQEAQDVAAYDEAENTRHAAPPRCELDMERLAWMKNWDRRRALQDELEALNDAIYPGAKTRHRQRSPDHGRRRETSPHRRRSPTPPPREYTRARAAGGYDIHATHQQQPYTRKRIYTQHSFNAAGLCIKCQQTINDVASCPG
jgi:hypothetical protein